MAGRIIRYEDPKPEDEVQEGAESPPAEESTEEAPADGGGEMPAEEPAPEMGGGGEGDMAAPPDHDTWLANFEFALQTNPLLFGLFQDYAQRMGGQGEQGGEMPPEAGAEAGMGGEMPPEGGESPEEQAAIDSVLGGGAEEMPPPNAEEPPVQNQQYALGMDRAMSEAGRGGRSLLGGAAGALGGAGIAAMTGQNPLHGAGIGGALGTAGGMAMQNDQIPLAYQAHLQNMEKRIAAVEARDQAKQREIANLKAVNSRKEAEMVVYQLQLEGYKPISTPERAEQLTAHLASLSPEQREMKVNEIRNCWEKDASMSYAASGAPVGGFVQVSSQKAESKPKFGEKELEIALAYQRTNPPELRGLSAEQKWEKCEQYAMNGGAVTG